MSELRGEWIENGIHYRLHKCLRALWLLLNAMRR